MAVESDPTTPAAPAPAADNTPEPTVSLVGDVAADLRAAVSAAWSSSSAVAVVAPPAPPAMPAAPSVPAPLPAPAEAAPGAAGAGAEVVVEPEPTVAVPADPAPPSPPSDPRSAADAAVVDDAPVPVVDLAASEPTAAPDSTATAAPAPAATVDAGPTAEAEVEPETAPADGGAPASEPVVVGAAVSAAVAAAAAASSGAGTVEPPEPRPSGGGFARQPWVWGVAVLAVVLIGGVVGLASRGGRASADADGGPGQTLRSTETTADPGIAIRAELTAALTVAPAPGTASVPLDAPVTVRTTAGKLVGIRAVTADGALLAGTLTADGRAWQSTGALAAGASYTVSGQVVADDGSTSVPVATSFSTLTPTATVKATVYPTDDDVVGVGQPLVIKFSKPITNEAARQAVLSHITVAASQPVPAGWHWFSKQELHLRPRDYWPAGDKITVITDLNGWNAGDGTTWGTGGVEVHYSIGDAHISTADLSTHKMVVTSNGAVVATYPFSGGREKYPTMNGVHLTMTREPVRHMVSSTVGIPVDSPDGYDEIVYNAVRITDGGEFVHAAPWSVGSQGSRNVSHGCINLSTANSKSFLEFSLLGDVVIVKGGPRAPELGDHGVMDWSSDWSIFSPGLIEQAGPNGEPLGPPADPAHLRPVNPTA